MDEQEKDDSYDLPAEKLRDLVTVAAPARMPEAIYLAEALEESGIPAMAEPQHFDGLAPGTRVFVPRHFADQAKEVIAKARADAVARGVEQAFDIESIADSTEDRPAGPLMERFMPERAKEEKRQQETLTAMFALRGVTPQARDEELRERVAAWILDGIPLLETAKYLAAAGLTQDEAAALVTDVTQQKRDECEEAGSTQLVLGASVALLGVLASIVSRALAAPGGLYFIYTGAILGGLVLMCTSRKKMPVFPKSEERPPES
jgi:hypothetical protein